MFNYCFSRLMRKTSQYGVVDDVAKNLHCINMYVSLRARASTHVKYKRAYHTRVRKHQLKEQMTNIYSCFSPRLFTVMAHTAYTKESAGEEKFTSGRCGGK